MSLENTDLLMKTALQEHHQLMCIKGPREAESPKSSPSKVLRVRKNEGGKVFVQPKEKAKKGVMPPNLSCRYYGHENRVGLGKASWADPWAKPRGHSF